MAVVYVLMFFKCKICFTVYTGEAKINDTYLLGLNNGNPNLFFTLLYKYTLVCTFGILYTWLTFKHKLFCLIQPPNDIALTGWFELYWVLSYLAIGPII